MTELKVTHQWSDDVDFDSNAVDWLGYNANTKSFYVEWNDSPNVYVYHDVPLQTVSDAVNADSVGAAVQDIKNTFGPGTNMGAEYYLDVVVQPYNPGGLRLVPNDGQPVVTKEFSLAEVPVNSGNPGLSVASDAYSYELFFDLDGTQRSHTINGKSTLDAALESLNDAAEALGVPIVVKKAVVTFV